MPVLRFTSVIKIRDGINPYIFVTPAQAKSIKPGWRRPLPVLVRINGKPAVPWRINMMPVGDGSFYLYLHGDESRRSRSGGGRLRCQVQERPAASRTFVVQGGAAKKSASPEELGSADPEPEEGDPPLLRAAEISGSARTQPRKSAACTIRQEGTLHGAGVE